MKKTVVQGLLAAVGVASSMSVALGQLAAPTSAQVWDVQFVVDNSGPFAQGPDATAVGITMVARVGIRPGTWNQANFGINRVGGAGSATSGFRMIFTDALSAGLGLSQGTIGQGLTDSGPFASSGRSYAAVGALDTSGDPLAGAYMPFREAFSGAGYPGDNDNPFNGSFINPATGTPIATAITLSRSRGWNNIPEAQGVGVVDAAGNFISGEYAPVYRFLYIPREDTSDMSIRNITVNVTGMSARYIFQLNGDLGSSGGTVNLPSQTFTFQVPTPGAFALAGLAGIAALRRRRA